MAKKSAKDKYKTADARSRYKANKSKNVNSFGNASKKGVSGNMVSKKVFLISIASCIAVALAIILIIVFVGGNNKNNTNAASNGSALDSSAGGTATNTSADGAASSTSADGAASNSTADASLNASAADTTASASAAGDTDIAADLQASRELFYYSEGIDINGFWKDIAAVDYVELADYMPLYIPKQYHEITYGDIRGEIYNLVDGFSPETQQVTNRAIKDGDKVNIDYIGSVDGVAFDGGNTMGNGTEVTAGSKNYIDDFLMQIIGHKPGETFDVEVTFPEDYGQEHLNGKDAVFVTTINYIIEYSITDDFVSENFSADYGWQTVDAMEANIGGDLQQMLIEDYVNECISSDATVHSIPEHIAAFQENRIELEESDMLAYYMEYAANYEMDLDSFLQYYVGVSSVDELIERNRVGIAMDTRRSITVQAIAESVGISVTDEDMENYMPDYMSYVDQYGLPWLKMYVLGIKVVEYLIDNAVLA